MTEELIEYPKISNKNNIEYDLQNTTGYKKYWTSKQTECNWTSNCLHWHHCDKETMENMSSTLPHIQKVMISIGNTLTDSIIHNDNEFQKLNTILNQQKYEEDMHIDKRKEKILFKSEHLNKKDEVTSLREQIFDLQNDLTSLRIHELGKLKKLIEQNQQVINMIKSIDIRELEITIHELNKKIPDIEPLLEEFKKMFKTLNNISKAVGYEE